VKPRQIAPTPDDTGSEMADNDQLPIEDDTAKEPYLVARDVACEDALDKVRKAQDTLNKAWAYDVHGRPSCGNRYCLNNHKSKSSSKLHMSTEFYRRSRVKSEEAYGGSLPEDIEAEFPPVGRC
jgi:hypothetical protein